MDDAVGPARIKMERVTMEISERSDILINTKEATALRMIEATTRIAAAITARVEATAMIAVAIEARVEAIEMSAGATATTTDRMTKLRMTIEAMAAIGATIDTLSNATTATKITTMAVEATAVPAEATTPTISRIDHSLVHQMAVDKVEAMTVAITATDSMRTSADRQLPDAAPFSTRCSSERAARIHTKPANGHGCCGMRLGSIRAPMIRSSLAIRRHDTRSCRRNTRGR